MIMANIKTVAGILAVMVVLGDSVIAQSRVIVRDDLPGSTAEGDILRGQGAYLRGLGSYTLNTAEADKMNAETIIRWKQELRRIESERRDRMDAGRLSKKIKAEALKKQRQLENLRLRVNPNADDIQNGRALNVLLYDLTDPTISAGAWVSHPISLPSGISVKELVFEFTPESGKSAASNALSRGVIAISRLGVVRNQWPTVMQQRELSEVRLRYQTAYATLRDQLVEGKFDQESLTELDRSLKALKEEVSSKVPQDRGYRNEALKYVSEIQNATKMFDASTVDYAREILVDTNKHDATNVGELIGFMLKYRLHFASMERERSSTGRAMYRQVFDLMRQQADALGIKPEVVELAVRPIPKNVAENIRALREHRPYFTQHINEIGPPELPRILDNIVQAAANNEPETFEKELSSAIKCVDKYKHPEQANAALARSDVLAVLKAIQNGKSDLSSVEVYANNKDPNSPKRVGLPGVRY